MKQLLYRMLEDIQSYKHNREYLMQLYVEERLQKSFNQYDKDLQQSISYLTHKHEKSLLKRMKNG